MPSSPVLWGLSLLLLFWAVGAYQRLLRLRAAAHQAFGALDAYLVRQQALLAEFLPYVETVQIDATPDGLPDIRDADDTIFLVLAAVGEADALVSGDGDIQALKAQFHIPIFTVAEFADWLQAH